MELVVHGNDWYTVGDNGAEFSYIPPNSVVFNHEQTKQLLQNGRINSRGTARAFGTTHLKRNANLHGTAYRLGGTTKKNNSGSKNNSGKNNNKITKKTSTDAEEFDWIERKIKSIENEIDNLDRKAERTYTSWSSRNSALTKELSKVKSEITTQNKAYDYYMKKANSVGLSSKYKKLVQNGKISISSIKDEKLQEKIKKYQDYYDKTIDAKNATEDLKDTLADLAKTKFNNTVTQYENALSDFEYTIEKTEAEIGLLEEQGYLVSSSYYDKLITTEKGNIDKLQEEKKALEKSLSTAVKEGSIKKYSEEWYQMKEDIREADLAIIDAKTNLASYNNELRQLRWDAFERIHDDISKINDEADFLIDLMDGKDLFNPDTGEITSEGLATQALHAIDYNTYMSEVKRYADEIAELQTQIANDPNNTNLLDQYDELIEKQQEAAKAAKSEKDAIKDLASEYHDSLLNALNKVIDKRKEALSDMSNLLDYEKDVAEQTKTISSLEKQLMASSMNRTEAGKAQTQKLQEELKQAKADLEQTEYDKWVEDQEQMFDSLTDDFEDWLTNRLQDTETLIAEAVDATNKNADTIKTTLEGIAGEFGITLSDEMESILSPSYKQDVVSSTSSSLSTVGITLSNIESAVLKIAGIEETKKVGASSGDLTNVTQSLEDRAKTVFYNNKKTYEDKGHISETSLADRLQYFGFDNSFSAKAKYYEAFGLGKSSSYIGSEIQDKFILKKMKAAGFKTGGTIGNLIKSTGEDGFVLARTGEEILSLEKINALQSVFKSMNPLLDQMTELQQEMTRLPNISNSTIRDVSVNVGDIQMYGVNDPQEFTVQLKESLLNDRSIKKIIQSETIGIMSGKNSLTKFKY